MSDREPIQAELRKRHYDSLDGKALCAVNFPSIRGRDLLVSVEDDQQELVTCKICRNIVRQIWRDIDERDDLVRLELAWREADKRQQGFWTAYYAELRLRRKGTFIHPRWRTA